MTHDDPTTRIRDRLADTFDDVAVGEVLHAVPPHVVHAVTVDGRRAVCKLAVGPEAVLGREAAAGAYAARATELPVPAVLAVGADFYVAEWLDAVPEPGADHDLENWAGAAGAGLARLHEGTPLEDHGLLRAAGGDAGGGDDAEGGAPGDDAEDGVPGVEIAAADSATAALAASLEDRRPGVAGTGYADVLDDAAAVLREHPDALAGAGDPVLCHGNWLPDHVGVDDGEVSAVIDFERALAAPAEHDYWRAAVPLFGGPGDGADPAREAFRAGYESVRPLPAGVDERADVHRLAIAASFVESLVVQDQHDPAATERKADRLREAVDDLGEAVRTQFG